MRRAILIAVTVLLMFGIAAGIYQVYYNHDIPMEYESFESKQKYIYSDRFFEGKFKSKDENVKIVGYDYTYETDDIYITLYTSIGNEEPLETDSQGFVTVRIAPGKEFDKVCYRCNDYEIILHTEDKEA